MNIERHNQIIAKIEENPSCWNQKEWHCGTAHCYGGWAQILSGKNADIRAVRRDARQWLGLSSFEADRAFSSVNTLEYLKSLPEMFSSNRDGLDANLNTKEQS